MAVIFALLILATILRLVIGVLLYLSARRNRLPNLYWLSAVFFLVFISQSFAPLPENPLGGFAISLWIFYGLPLLTGLCIIAFIDTTFHANTYSPRRWMVGLHLVLGVPALYGLAVSDIPFGQVSLLVAGMFFSFVMLWGWHTVVAWKAHSSILSDETVEDWVKVRYQLMIAYAVLLVVNNIASAIRILFAGGGINSVLGSAMALVTLVSMIIAVILQYLVWAMPEGFRKWLNRNQQTHVEERVHEHALAVLNLLGSAMADETGISKILAMFSIRTVIGMEIHSEDTALIEARASNMGFEEWAATLNDPELYILVKNAGIDTKPAEVIDRAKCALIERQSLFTMKAK